jgi:hypothetical protein
MKHNFGQTHRTLVRQRIALWKQSHPIDATLPPPTQQLPAGSSPSDVPITQTNDRRNPENTHVLGQPAVTGTGDVGGNGEVAGNIPDEFVAARSLTDEQVISL